MQWTVVGWFRDGFIEIEFEYHTIHSFEAYNSVDFGILTLSNHHLYLILSPQKETPASAPDTHELTLYPCGCACLDISHTWNHTLWPCVSGFSH